MGEKYYLADHGIREFGAYAGSRDNFPKYVVSMDEISMGQDGIRRCHIRDFLLAPAWG